MWHLVRAVVVMVALGALGASAGPTAEVGETSLGRALDAFDAALEPLVSTGSAVEQAEAIAALAQVRSPRFAVARDALAAGADKQVWMALLRAMNTCRDESPGAREVLFAALEVEDHEVVTMAATAMYGVHLHVPLSRLRGGDGTSWFWTSYVPRSGFQFLLVDGVAAVRPWREPEWEKLPRAYQLRLLARGGTSESLTLLVQALERGSDDPARLGLPPAEPVDLPALRRLLGHARPEVRAFASMSLLEAGDEEHEREIVDRIREVKDLGGPEQRRALEGLAVAQLLRTSGAGVARVASHLQFDQHFYTSVLRLDELGEPLGFDDLKDRYDRAPPAPVVVPTRTAADWSVEERDAAQYRSLLLRWLTKAMVRERRYSELLPLIRPLLGKEQVYSLRDVRDQLDGEFLAGIPADVAHECVIAIRAALRERSPEGRFYTNGDQQEATPALVLLGLLARGDDADELWRAFREGPDPLWSFERLMPVGWGFARRSEELRLELAKHVGKGWFHLASNSADLLRGYSSPSRECPGTWDPFKIVGTTDTLVRARRELARALEVAFPSRDERALQRAFNAVRGLEYYRLRPDELPPASRPGPPLSTEDRAWLEGVLRGMRTARFQTIVERKGIDARGISCFGGPQPTRDLVPAPSGIFLGAGLDHLEDVQKLLTSTDRINRHEAAWALWNWKRDPHALDVLITDAGASDSLVRASALSILRYIRHAPAASLFVAALDAEAPEVRQVGLRGVAAFRIAAALPKVQMLVLDPDGTVAETAIEVLGQMRPAGTRELLLGLLSEGGRLAYVASTSLAKLRSREDMDAYVKKLGATETSPDEKWLLLDVLRAVTWERRSWTNERDRAPGKPPPEELVAEWTSWWAKHRVGSQEDWIKSRLEVLVRDYTAMPELPVGSMLSRYEQRAFYARNVLEGYSALRSLPIPRDTTEKNRETVRAWWEQNRGRDLWAIHSPYGFVDPSAIPRLLEVEPQKARQELFGYFMRTAQMSGRTSESQNHRQLVDESGVDFGDPTLVSCELREKVLADWVSWASANGWERSGQGRQ